MNGLPILAFHAIDDSGGVLSTPLHHFRDTIAALISEGFRGVDLADWIERGRPVVDRGFAVTFDDGLRSILLAAEVLSRFGVPATVFLVAGRMGLDNGWPGQPRGLPRMATLAWSELANLRDADFRFGAHTLTHPHMDECSQKKMSEEMIGSRAAIEDVTGNPCGLFAYPYGEASAPAREAARRYFDASFGTRLAYASSGEPIDRISRIDAYYLRSSRAVAALASGALPGLLRWRRAARGAKRLVAAVGGGRASRREVGYPEPSEA